MKWFRESIKELFRYPSAILGLLIIGLMLAAAVAAPIIMPYEEATMMWRGGEAVFMTNPRYARPTWVNFFRTDKLPETIHIDSAEGEAEKTVTPGEGGVSETVIVYEFDYNYEQFPEDVALFFDLDYDQKTPHVSMVWVTPDGQEINIRNIDLTAISSYRFPQDERLKKVVRNVPIQQALFLSEEDTVIARQIAAAKKAAESGQEIPEDVDINQQLQAQPGTYQLILTAKTFEEGNNVDGTLVVFGEVFGWAGTDHLRRDLGIALLWGTPIALMFGLLAAVGTSVMTMIIAAIGVWFGGWVDALIQRITEVNLVLPLLSILVMVGTFYSRSIWLMLGLVILLSIFGGGIKTYRAIFLQVKESSYIEAARSYGARDLRIVFRYLIPRVIPLLLPGLVVAVPSFVFLEAALAVLGLGDPIVPTWGKIISEARSNGALFNGYYYWMLEPAFLLMFVGLGFAMLGFSLDRVFNPRLRGL